MKIDCGWLMRGRVLDTTEIEQSQKSIDGVISLHVGCQLFDFCDQNGRMHSVLLISPPVIIVIKVQLSS